jgi:Cu2+-exporting ATPase/Cu+-exporting ATPase
MEKENPISSTVKVFGMTCASCARNIERTLKKQTGVAWVEVNYGTETAMLRFDKEKTDIQKLSAAISPLGYALEKERDMKETMHHEDHGMKHSQGGVEELRRKTRQALPLVIISAIIMAIELLAGRWGIPELPEWAMELFHHLLPIMATYMLFGIGAQYLRAIWGFFRTRVANMDTLIGIGTSVAFLYSFILTAFEKTLEPFLDVSVTYYDVTIIVIGLITLGKYLEARAKERTGEAIQKLLGLQAKTAFVSRNGKELEIPIAEVVHGDFILIKPHSKIPVDGVITEGVSYIDESMLTGESMPESKRVGDAVRAGTMNTNGSFTFRATGIGSETLLAHIVKLVSEAQASRAPIERMADKISAVFVPLVLLTAFLSFGAWLLFGSGALGFSSALAFGIDKIIVGEEIMTTEGEIVGLFLNKHITPNQSLEATISDIKKQDGIVYVPHPFETVRKGLSSVALERVQEEIDIIESANGRALFQNKGPEDHAWAHLRRVATFASSDAHRAKALGKTHTTLEKTPTKETLVSLARKGKKSYTRPNLGDVLAPKRAKIVKIIRRQKNA